MTHHIAGHLFDLNGHCVCGQRWLNIRSTNRAEIGQHNIAHTGHLTENEYNQIEAARDDEDKRIAAATSELSGRTR